MKYYVSTEVHGEKEVDKETYIKFERGAGFRSKLGDGEIATAGFTSGGISGRVDYNVEEAALKASASTVGQQPAGQNVNESVDNGAVATSPDPASV
jgi:hypothetical protein